MKKRLDQLKLLDETNTKSKRDLYDKLKSYYGDANGESGEREELFVVLGIFAEKNRQTSIARHSSCGCPSQIERRRLQSH